MSKKVRAKFEVISFEHGTNDSTSGTIILEPRYDETIPEDQLFNKATPWGKLEMFINNPAAIELLQPGRTFYLDLILVGEE